MVEVGRRMIEALIAGERDPVVLAELALGQDASQDPRVDRSVGVELDAPTTASSPRQIIAHIDFLDATIDELSSGEIGERSALSAIWSSGCCEIPGVSRQRPPRS